MKKVTYKIEQFKSMTIEVESDEQVQKIEELNRDFERTDRQNRRIKAKTDSLDQMYEAGCELIADTPTPEEALLQSKEESEVKKRVHNAISKLKPRQQQIIYMAYFENKTQEEIAKALGVSQQAISESLPRLLAKLKKILGKK